MTRRALAAALTISAVTLASCGGTPPPPATETPFPVSIFPYPAGTTVSLEGRNPAGRVVLSRIDALSDVITSRNVACQMAHGSTARVVGAQYQPTERRWYLLVNQPDCEGYVPEALIRRVG